MDIILNLFDDRGLPARWWVTFNKTIWAKSKTYDEYDENQNIELSKFNAIYHNIPQAHIKFQTEEYMTLFLLKYS
jgi:hypothetical protein